MSEVVEPGEANQIDYVAMQRHYYDERATTMTEAQALVHPDFGLAQAQAVPTQAHALLEVIRGKKRRTLTIKLAPRPSTPPPAG